MRLLLDACVIYPTVMREMLIGVAKTGAFTPLWSARILEEWARAARKLGPEGEAIARGDIALMRAAFPKAEIAPQPGLEARLYLPDPDDIHVLAAAIAGHADAIVTLNRKDFPKNILAEEDLGRMDPDGILYGTWLGDPEGVAEVAENVRQTAERLSGQPQDMRKLLKKARLPRLAKALG